MRVYISGGSRFYIGIHLPFYQSYRANRVVRTLEIVANDDEERTMAYDLSRSPS